MKFVNGLVVNEANVLHQLAHLLHQYFDKLKILTINDIHILEVAKLMHCIHLKQNNAVSDSFKFTTSIHQHNTQYSNNKFNLHILRLEQGCRNPGGMGAGAYLGGNHDAMPPLWAASIV